MDGNIKLFEADVPLRVFSFDAEPVMKIANSDSPVNKKENMRRIESDIAVQRDMEGVMVQSNEFNSSPSYTNKANEY